MTVDAFPDTEGAIRTWLRAQPAVTALVGQRVFFGIPKGATEATFPLISVQLVSTVPDPSEAPIDRALLQIDCWGSLDASGNGQKAAATALVNTVRALLHSITQPTPMGTVTVFGCNVESVTWLPDPTNDRPRYSLSAEVTAIRT
jgi:hypothetical protein